MKSFEFKQKCVNPRCTEHEKILDWIHIDDCIHTYEPYMHLNREEDAKLTGKKFTEMPYRFHVAECVCSVCNHQMEATETKEALPKKEYKMIHVPADAKTRPGYYTKWKTTSGGKPGWNPTTNIGGTGKKGE